MIFGLVERPWSTERRGILKSILFDNDGGDAIRKIRADCERAVCPNLCTRDRKVYAAYAACPGAASRGKFPLETVK
jgi:hypothetical protein